VSWDNCGTDFDSVMEVFTTYFKDIVAISFLSIVYQCLFKVNNYKYNLFILM
jgi:hypothetical protein